MQWFEGKKQAKKGVKNARFQPPFSAKNTDAEANFLDAAPKMMQNHFWVSRIIKYNNNRKTDIAEELMCVIAH